jgi:RNA polymerase sigma factor (TIGR02999 family)
MRAQLLIAGNFLGVLGNELWIEGTKHIGGLIAVRRGTSSIAPENLPVLRCGDSETEGQHMVQPPSSEITGLLRAWSHGDEDALARVVKLVYPELRDIARRCLSRERPGHTIQATALVHEAYLRLVDIRQVQWQDRAHFFAVGARVMRRVLVDYARARDCAKREGVARRTPLDDALLLSSEPDPIVIRLHEALECLAEFDSRKAQVVEMRYFGGLTSEEIAAVLHISTQSVNRDWSLAKAWLVREMNREERDGPQQLGGN